MLAPDVAGQRTNGAGEHNSLRRTMSTDAADDCEPGKWKHGHALLRGMTSVGNKGRRFAR
jgi:hypothetical protein